MGQFESAIHCTHPGGVFLPPPVQRTGAGPASGLPPAPLEDVVPDDVPELLLPEPLLEVMPLPELPLPELAFPPLLLPLTLPELEPLPLPPASPPPAVPSGVPASGAVAGDDPEQLRDAMGTTARNANDATRLACTALALRFIRHLHARDDTRVDGQWAMRNVRMSVVGDEFRVSKKYL